MDTLETLTAEFLEEGKATPREARILAALVRVLNTLPEWQEGTFGPGSVLDEANDVLLDFTRPCEA